MSWVIWSIYKIQPILCTSNEQLKLKFFFTKQKFYFIYFFLLYIFFNLKFKNNMQLSSTSVEL